MRQCLIANAVSIALCSLPAQVLAVPPPAAVAVGAVTGARWIQHRIIPGERLAEIAERYRVGVTKLLEWNKLDPHQPVLRVGQKLRVYTEDPPAEREAQAYMVRDGDSWAKLAKHFGVEQERLRGRWNPGITTLKPGIKLTVWREAKEPREAKSFVDARGARLLAAKVDETSYGDEQSVKPERDDWALSEVAPNGLSMGSAAHGRLSGGVQLPKNDALYTIRNPDNTWGSSFAVGELQRGIRELRKSTGFDRELVVEDMSREHGGRFRPHHSHTSGRDVDIRLPLRAGLSNGTIPNQIGQVDWDATWALIHAFAKGGQIQYVFLSRTRQPFLYEAAKRAGTSPEELERLIQFPKHSPTAIVRNAHGHTEHIHVRFKCGPSERSCHDP